MFCIDRHATSLSGKWSVVRKISGLATRAVDALNEPYLHGLSDKITGMSYQSRFQTCQLRCFALVPAAGSGVRLGARMPKQYLPMAGRPMIWHALAAMCRNTRIAQVWVVLSTGDAWWDGYDWSVLGEKLRPVFCGGDTRAESVANGLAAMAGELAEDDWALVHDAARPCLSQVLLNAFLDELAHDPVGGLLALPVADTLKCARFQPFGLAEQGESEEPGALLGPRVTATVSRDGLWQAQTPQMFRYGLLRRALEGLRDVTDEASAVEQAGFSPRLVCSDARNLKVTYPADLELAELILQGADK